MFKLQYVSAKFGGRQVLNVPQLELHPNQITVLLGHNGSGKSTLMSGLAREVRLEGNLQLTGAPIDSLTTRQFSQRISYLPQDLPEAPGLTVNEMVLLARYPWRGPLRRWTEEDHTQTKLAIQKFDVDAFTNTLVDKLSGGERQRAWIAAQIAQGAQYLLMDEPLSALDIPHQKLVLKKLKQHTLETGVGQFVILHDVNLTASFADRIIALKSGQITFDGTPSELMSAEVLHRIYGVAPAILTHPETQSKIAVF